MRGIGILLILAGLAAAFGYPAYYDSFSHFEIGNYRIYDEETGFRDHNIALSPRDAPIAIEFLAKVDGEEVLAGSATSIILSRAPLNATKIDLDTITFSSSVGADKEGNKLELLESLPSFEVEVSSIYRFEFSEGPAQDIAFSSIDMKLEGLVGGKSGTIPNIGHILLGFGALMYVVGGRKKTPSNGNAPSGKRSKTSQIGRRADPEPAKAEKSKQPTRKWGRGD